MDQLMSYFNPKEWFKSLTDNRAIIAKIDKIEVKGNSDDLKALKEAMEDHVNTLKSQLAAREQEVSSLKKKLKLAENSLNLFSLTVIGILVAILALMFFLLVSKRC